jgi:hypothetical protein
MKGTDESLSPPSVKKLRRSRDSRQVDYVVAVALDALLLFVLNVWPTWASLPFVTVDAIQAVTILNIATVVNIDLNGLCLAVDFGWLKPLTEFINAVFSLMFAMEVRRSFPFNLPAGSVDWELIARLAILVTIIGSVIGIIVQFVLVVVRVIQNSDASA